MCPWFLLRSLEHSGVATILILADPVGINDSLCEGFVAGPGVRYALESVEAPNRAFHAKIGILWSQERLLLAVGSGNLTFAGMHRNAEIWEVLTAGIAESPPERHLSREVGAGLLRFLDYLSSRVDAGGRSATTLITATQAVRNWLPRFPETEPRIYWLDSTHEPIGPQFSRLLGSAPNRRLRFSLRPPIPPAERSIASRIRSARAKSTCSTPDRARRSR